jgi:viologen exporter family transport system permease protein
MKRLIESYQGHFRVTLTRYLTYRVELVIWLISMILQPIVFMAVWSSAAANSGGTVSGYSPNEISAYFIIAMLVNHATMAWVMWEWDARVRGGELSYLLLRPNHVFHRDLAENVTFKLATFPVMLATALLLIAATSPHIVITPYAAMAIIPCLILSFCLRFTVDWVCAMGAFFTTRVDALNVLYFFVLLLFSGQMAPVPFLPEPMRVIANFLPFRWTVDFPARLLMGKLSDAEILPGLAAQALWCLVICGLCVFVWRRGVRGYTAVGI